MAGGSTTLTVLRDALETVLVTIANLKVYDYEPRETDTLPAAMIGLPALTRTDPDEGESELGRYDWHSVWPVTLALRMDDPQAAQNEALQLAGQIIGAFDADPTLGSSPGVLETKVVSAEPSYSTEDGNRQLALYELQVAVYQLVT